MIGRLWPKTVEFHGHACPGPAIGVRACEAVKRHPALGDVEYGKFKCVTENDAFGVDAIQRLLGCSIGKGNLTYGNVGKMAYSFFDTKRGERMRLYLNHSAKPENASREQWLELLFIEKIFSPFISKAQEPAGIFSAVISEIHGEGAAKSRIRLDDGKKVRLDCCHIYDRGW